jgi:hypothetical protein
MSLFSPPKIPKKVFPKNIWTNHNNRASEDRYIDSVKAGCIKKLKTKLECFGFEYKGHGRHRITFRAPCKTKVFKLPIGSRGINDNQTEYELYKIRHSLKQGWDKNLAKCKLMRHGVLVMEYVEDISGHNDSERYEPDLFPEWAEDYIECVQVGLNSSGDVVVFDYASDAACIKNDFFLEKEN